MSTENLLHPSTYTIYTVTRDNLISCWIDIYHRKDHVVVIYEALTHLDYLETLGFHTDRTKTYNSEILTIKFDLFDDAINFCKKSSHEKGPYIQIWSLGTMITNNIEK